MRQLKDSIGPAARLEHLLTDNRMSIADLARELPCTYRSAHSWLRGERGIPERVIQWLETRADWLLTCPQPPQDWRRGRPFSVDTPEDRQLLEAWRRGA